jgi:hypothetical protein
MEGTYGVQHRKGNNGFELASRDTTWQVSQSYIINDRVHMRESDRDYVRLRTPDGRTQPTISVTTPSGNTREISIDRVTISYNAPARIVGDSMNNGLSEIGPGSATITINDRPYDPEAWSRVSRANRADHHFDNRLQFTLLPNGEMSDISVGRNSGMTMEAAGDGTRVDSAQFLNEMSFLIDGTQLNAGMPEQPFQ